MQEGAFALCFKSKHFPGECVATRRGSPLLVGIKTKTRLATDYVPILYGKGNIVHYNYSVKRARLKKIYVTHLIFFSFDLVNGYFLLHWCTGMEFCISFKMHGIEDFI